MAETGNAEFQFAGVNHLEPVWRDMPETVDHGLLGTPVPMTTSHGRDGHQHQIFFFDIGVSHAEERGLAPAAPCVEQVGAGVLVIAAAKSDNHTTKGMQA